MYSQQWKLFHIRPSENLGFSPGPIQGWAILIHFFKNNGTTYTTVIFKLASAPEERITMLSL
jgi:hypothetical protein